MIVGNSMIGIVLGVNKLCSDMEDKRVEIENLLMLGVSLVYVIREIVNGVFDSVILFMMNNMLIMGIVLLLGMMIG